MNTDYTYTTTSTELSGGQAAALGIGMIIFMLFMFALIAIPAIISWWKLFEKAGQPGWAALIPIYNIYVMTQIAKAPITYLVLMFVPVVSIVGVILLTVELAKQYDKPATIWLAQFFPIIAVFMVGSTNYIGGSVGNQPQPGVPQATMQQ